MSVIQKRVILITITFASLLVGLSARSARAQQSPPPIVQVDQLKKISEHVRVILDNDVDFVSNIGFVVGDKAVLVIDTGMGARNGAAVAHVARKLAGKRKIYLVTTHVHPEHDLGAQGFPADITMIRSVDQEKDIAEFGLSLAKLFASMSRINAELLEGARFREADITFTNSLELELGSLRVRLLALGANHTRGDTGVWIEADRVLFAGDVAMKGTPALASPQSTMAHWMETLNRVEALEPSVIVPSHGPVGGLEFLPPYRTFLTTIRDRTAAAKKAGRTVDEAVAEITAALSERYPDRLHLDWAVRALYAELQ
ncbi:beta-lactamase domain protein [Cystobacter fuscus]|uniref:Beta-lactamase domain protein n=1 Tax=Cystobacter fuscus TaxID=43 RepID=A0A250JBS5_9BACT|nr:MBL fold metallo-hydrolase [Cystobacter fuscus]ATB41354.1 beta-lactamase domain protein [Cystobacter fuscus]